MLHAFSLQTDGEKLNLTVLIARITELTGTITALSVTTTSWTQDYTWLYNYQWGSFLDNIMSSYTNQTLEET